MRDCTLTKESDGGRAEVHTATEDALPRAVGFGRTCDNRLARCECNLKIGMGSVFTGSIGLLGNGNQV